MQKLRISVFLIHKGAVFRCIFVFTFSRKLVTTQSTTREVTKNYIFRFLVEQIPPKSEFLISDLELFFQALFKELSRNVDGDVVVFLVQYSKSTFSIISFQYFFRKNLFCSELDLGRPEEHIYSSTGTLHIMVGS